MTFQSIIVETEEGVATLTLNRPEKLNAFNPTLLHETAAAIRDMNDDDEIKVLIITGAGRGFCSGHDFPNR